MFLFVFSFNKSICQESCIPPNVSVWDDDYLEVDLDIASGIARAKVKQATDYLEFDWSSFVNNSYASDGAMKALLEASWVLYNAPRYQMPVVFHMNVVSKSYCKANLKYYVKLDETSSVRCCDAGVTFDEDFFIYESHTYYSVNKHVTCGEKCCRKVYVISYFWDDTIYPAQYMPKISSVYREEMSSCSSETTGMVDCLTGAPIPCVDGSCP